MRGTRQRRLEEAELNGIIPAYAGNTQLHVDQCQRAWDHPRVCGEHAGIDATVQDAAGSSPRMRGTHRGIEEFSKNHGIIPAYAGNTQSVGLYQALQRDHPRVCGEHIDDLAAERDTEGSSPRMRGTRHRDEGAGRSQGIIPAYAGNTCSPLRHPPRCRDHPRVCGEHGGYRVFQAIHSGSSPRMRGTLPLNTRLENHPGIIPAYAGNTCRCP